MAPNHCDGHRPGAAAAEGPRKISVDAILGRAGDGGIPGKAAAAPVAGTEAEAVPEPEPEPEPEAGESLTESGADGAAFAIGPIRDGPPVRFGSGGIASLAQGSVAASAGKTVVTCAVAYQPGGAGGGIVAETPSPSSAVLRSVRARCRRHTGMLPLTVSYAERHAGVGRIPGNAARRDNTRPTDGEVLAARAIDRALRPLLPRDGYGPEDAVEITCSVQACDLAPGGGDPLALAINAVSAAMLRSGLPLKEPVGAVRVCLAAEDGGGGGATVVFDPSLAEVGSSSLDLLVAATRTRIVMIEFGGGRGRGGANPAGADPNPDPGVPEAIVEHVLRLAHGHIGGIIDVQEDRDPGEGSDTAAPPVSDADILRDLGLDVDLDLDLGAGLSEKSPMGAVTVAEPTPSGDAMEMAELIIEHAFGCISRGLADTMDRLFSGSRGQDSVDDDPSPQMGLALVHDGPPLIPKAVRGRREHLVRQEVERRLRKETGPSEPALRGIYQDLLEDPATFDTLASSIHERMMTAAMYRSAVLDGGRADGRFGADHAGLRTLRPIEASVPLLPDVVHGSSFFRRGETSVLCTATLGAPKDGQRVINPYVATGGFDLTLPSEDDSQELPVGSLRFLRNQVALESDLNSRKVRADREMTGESGTLGEVRRAFLHYDFPPYSTGQVRKGGMIAANRREVGHGSLAEKAILPILPPPSAFPYAIRMTSEVTSSNGSSSMASVCGATLALLDAGVPILAPAVGVSVGLVRGSDSNGDESYGLMLDITGTEDHYGEMDFKIAGTERGVTAMQLDVKRPLPLDMVVQAMHLAREGRYAMLDAMDQSAAQSSSGIIQGLKPRQRLKESAPRVEIVRFDPVRKRDLIGPGGAVLKQLEDRYSVSLDLSQEGQCLLYGPDATVVATAKAAVMDLVANVEEGEVYEGTVIEIKDFGAVVELLRNKEGLLHVSELASVVDARGQPEGNHGLVKTQVQLGQKIKVVCIGVDPVQGHIKLSQKRLLRQGRRA